MKDKDKSLPAPWIRRVLFEHLVAERNLSRNTQASYRDAYLIATVCQQAGRLCHRSHDRGGVDTGSHPQLSRSPAA